MITDYFLINFSCWKNGLLNQEADRMNLYLNLIVSFRIVFIYGYFPLKIIGNVHVQVVVAEIEVCVTKIHVIVLNEF